MQWWRCSGLAWLPPIIATIQLAIVGISSREYVNTLERELLNVAVVVELAIPKVIESFEPNGSPKPLNTLLNI